MAFLVVLRTKNSGLAVYVNVLLVPLLIFREMSSRLRALVVALVIPFSWWCRRLLDGVCGRHTCSTLRIVVYKLGAKYW